MHIRRAVLGAVVLALVGCATSTLDPQVKSTVRSVFVEPPQLPALPSVVAPEGGALSVTSGQSAPAPKDAPQRLKAILDARVGLAKVITDQAERELLSKGYRVAPSASSADAILRFTVHHGLGVAATTSNARGVSMMVNMGLYRSNDDKRLLFAVENLITNPAAKSQVRVERFDVWFSNEELTASQYRLIAQSLVSQAMSGL